MPTQIKLAVVGSRTFNKKKVLFDVIDNLVKEQDYEIVEIISGAAKGADSLSEIYAKERNIPTKIFEADWKKFRNAGLMRNHYIIENCDVCLAFWNSKSTGTKADIRLCRQLGKICWIYEFNQKKLYLSK